MAVSQSNLKGIGIACIVYANDHQDQFPESLDVLVQEEFITRKMLMSPITDDPMAYTYIPRTTTMAQERNPARSVLAYEVVRDDDKALVLFVDGHTEAVPLERFKTLLRETYKNIGREDEIPAEFRGSGGAVY
jgi:hypothetical protein